MIIKRNRSICSVSNLKDIYSLLHSFIHLSSMGEVSQCPETFRIGQRSHKRWGKKKKNLLWGLPQVTAWKAWRGGCGHPDTQHSPWRYLLWSLSPAEIPLRLWKKDEKKILYLSESWSNLYELTSTFILVRVRILNCHTGRCGNQVMKMHSWNCFSTHWWYENQLWLNLWIAWVKNESIFLLQWLAASRIFQPGKNADLFMRSIKRHTPNTAFLAELSVTFSHLLSCIDKVNAGNQSQAYITSKYYDHIHLQNTQTLSSLN